MTIAPGIRSGLRSGIRSGLNPTDTAGANRLVVFIGQSNAGGVMVAASVSNYPGIANDYPAVTMVEHGAGGGATDPPTWTDEAARPLGPRDVNFGGSFAIGTGGAELSMLQDLDIAYPDDTWYAAKMWIDGSSLVTEWANPDYPTLDPDLKTQLNTFISTQVSAFGITNTAENLVMVFIQGTADDGQAYATYLASMGTLFTDSIRATFGNCRIVIVREYHTVDSAFNVRAAQMEYASATTGVEWIPTDDLSLRDTAHYTDNSYATIGVRLADKLQAMIDGTAETSPYVVAVGPIANAISTAACAPVLPTHQAGDTLVVILAGSGQNNYAAPAGGWAEVTDSPQHDAGSGLNARAQAWWLRATDSTTADPSISDVASDGTKVGVAIVIRGAAVSPLDDTNGDTTTVAGTAVAIPGGTTVTSNALVLAVCASIFDNFTQPQHGQPTNADLSDVMMQINYCTNVGAGVQLAIISGRKASAGAFGTTTTTLANSAASQARIMIALKP